MPVFVNIIFRPIWYP